MTVTWSDEQMVEVIEKWRHFKWRSLGEKWPSLLSDKQMVMSFRSDVTSSDGHFWKFSKIFFYFKWCKIAQNAKIKQKKIFKNFEKWRHLKWRADGRVIRSDRHFSSDVTFSRSDRHFFKWRADGKSQCATTSTTLLNGKVFWLNLPQMTLL